MNPRPVLRKVAAGAVLACATLVAATVPVSATSPVLQSATVAKHHHVLVDASGHTLYILTSEAGGKIKCVKTCLNAWPAVMLPENVSMFSHSAAVKGSLGYVKRGKFRQATFNGFPLYTYAGDAKAHEDNGLGLTSDGGTWVLVNASAKTANATPVAGASTASSSSGGGW